MNIINCTPHALNIYRMTDDAAPLVIEPSGIVVRCAEERTALDPIGDLPVARVAFGNVTGLPEPAADTIYIVSALVLSALDGERGDVFAPGAAVRNAAGQQIGCIGLTAPAPSKWTRSQLMTLLDVENAATDSYGTGSEVSRAVYMGDVVAGSHLAALGAQIRAILDAETPKELSADEIAALGEGIEVAQGRNLYLRDLKVLVKVDFGDDYREARATIKATDDRAAVLERIRQNIAGYRELVESDSGE